MDSHQRRVRCSHRLRRACPRSRPARSPFAYPRLGRPPPPQRSGVPTHGRRDRSRAVRSVTTRQDTAPRRGGVLGPGFSLGTLLVALLPGAAATAQQLAFTPYHATGTYAVRERVGWHVSV